MNRFNFATLIVFLLTGAPSSAQITSSQIDSIVEAMILQYEVAGVSLGIVKDGEIIHATGYGVTSVATQAAVDEHSQFAIASNSKAFTTTALALLVEDGQIAWTDKVVDYIPEFKMYDDYVTLNFNIQDLLTHRSGLGLGVGDLMFFPDGADFTIGDILSAFQYFEPQSAFRTKFDYDNLLYIVAGELIERVTGMTWESFVTERIFTPLGMKDSYASILSIEYQSNMAHPHSDESGSVQVIPPFSKMVNGAAGGIMSSAYDMCLWMLTHLNKGSYGDDKSLFSPSSQREMWKIHTTVDASANPRYNAHFAGYGLGWFLTDILGNMSVSHTGGLPGMLSKVTMIPDLQLGVVVLTNTSNSGGALFNALSLTIVDSYLGLDDHHWGEKMYEYLQYRKTQSDTITPMVSHYIDTHTDENIRYEDYMGVYRDPWFGEIEVTTKDGHLWFYAKRSPKLNGRMYHYKANTLAIKWEYQDMNADAFAMFCLDENGVAQSIKMRGISPNIDFSFDFHDLDLQRLAE